MPDRDEKLVSALRELLGQRGSDESIPDAVPQKSSSEVAVDLLIGQMVDKAKDCYSTGELLQIAQAVEHLSTAKCTLIRARQHGAVSL